MIVPPASLSVPSASPALLEHPAKLRDTTEIVASVNKFFCLKIIFSPIQFTTPHKVRLLLLFLRILRLFSPSDCYVATPGVRTPHAERDRSDLNPSSVLESR